MSDEAAALAALSLFPILTTFAATADIAIEVIDISLASRMLAAFPEGLGAEQRIEDPLRRLKALRLCGEAVIVKSPCISASLKQLRLAAEELRGQGFAVPDYPERPVTTRQSEVRGRYEALRGSVVNGVLRHGTSVRSAAHFGPDESRGAGASFPTSRISDRSCIASMVEGDFCGSETALTLQSDLALEIEHVSASGRIVRLCTVSGRRGDVLEAAVMQRSALRTFLDAEFRSARLDGLLVEVPLKQTSFPVSEGAIFAEAVSVYYAEVLKSNGDAVERLEWAPTAGVGPLIEAAGLAAEGAALRRGIDEAHRRGPDLAFSRPPRARRALDEPGRGSTAIVMASAIANGARCLDGAGKLRDTKYLIPNRTEARFFAAVLDDLRLHGTLRAGDAGRAIIVGLSANASDEYGAADTTFVLEAPGRVRIRDRRGEVYLEHEVAAGDIWRSCQRSREATIDWISSALNAGARAAAPVVFWLDADRPRDREALQLLRRFCPEAEWGVQKVHVLGVEAAVRMTLDSLRRGEAIVAATGNLMRDYLGELLAGLGGGGAHLQEVATNLLNGGKLFEAGGGGCAPMVAVDFLRSNYLRWDPRGDLLAWRGAFDALGASTDDPAAELASALGRASRALAEQGLLPGRWPGTRDTRGSNFHLARLWAGELEASATMGDRFAALSRRLEAAVAQIDQEFISVQGRAVDVGGYYHPDARRLASVMNASPTFSQILETL